MENRPLVKFLSKLHPGFEWRIFHILTSEDIDDVISALTLLFTQKCSCLYNKKKIAQCFYHSKIKFICSRRRVISSLYIDIKCQDFLIFATLFEDCR